MGALLCFTGGWESEDGASRSAQPSFLPFNRDTCCQTPASDDVDMLKLKLKVDKVRMLVVASVS